MGSALWCLLAVAAAFLLLWLISYLVEGLRRAPRAPTMLRWAPQIAVNHIDVDACRLRYIKTGQGKPLVLLHTLRTQLDLFEKVVPELSTRFTVYALDYPGHGFSDIPAGRYDAEFFARGVGQFLEKLGLREVVMCGVSIGGAIALILAGNGNDRIARVVAVNPYDYARGRGMARGSWLGWMITQTAQIPVVGPMVMRLRNFAIMEAVLEGGVAERTSIPPALMREMYEVGNRRGHYRAFISLLRHASSFEAARRCYAHIKLPVLVVWGDKDWARADERDQEQALIPAAQTATIANGGHFLPLDRPRELQDLIIRFVETGA